MIFVFLALLKYRFSCFKNILTTQSRISRQTQMWIAVSFCNLDLFFLKLTGPYFKLKTAIKKKNILKPHVSTLLEILSIIYISFKVDWFIKSTSGVSNLFSSNKQLSKDAKIELFSVFRNKRFTSEKWNSKTYLDAWKQEDQELFRRT